MSDVEKTQWKLPPATNGSGKGNSLPTNSRNQGKSIYQTHERFAWDTTYVKEAKLQARRIQTNGIDPVDLGDTVSLIKLEEEAIAPTGYNPYDSGLTAMKQSRKPAELHDLTRHNTHMRKFGK
ncbi:MAG TPA: hypothetical protein VHL14_04375 [Steroidobacteraceae bacterium]|jgi:hypothetical protein|nr:hypothetical protein [Steroidobacteraceae bacterium]